MPRPLSIVDLGGTVRFWEAWGFDKEEDVRITLINNHQRDTTNKHVQPSSPNIANISADATQISDSFLEDFDLIFSNSFIEHLPGPLSQAAIATRIVNSGKPYFIQTPNKYSVLDPHFPRPYVPFFAAYPRRLQALLLTWTDLGSGCVSPSMEEAMRRLTYYHPLSLSDVRELFPDAKLLLERPMGVPMSIVALRR